jgi:hypothetical protein
MRSGFDRLVGIKLPVEINASERLEIPVPEWLYEKGPKFWLLGMSAFTIEEAGEAYKVEVLLVPRKDEETKDSP